MSFIGVPHLHMAHYRCVSNRFMPIRCFTFILASIVFGSSKPHGELSASLSHGSHLNGDGVSYSLSKPLGISVPLATADKESFTAKPS